ncbi:hypothetical protein [Leptotrichia sp. oral taxon 879]|uniref:hypothetical protein n=1 Tax=Leptotrichia sp. oral taxon 879 TaxID=1227267 RepID=UPI0003AE4926|nr:hypothetical protein [Leptotrichia sp. oral taxon 879]ERK50097.1 hypothetical protein HMPREF1552_01614 [Leptotrichia sp. oral taxon 879 str. F0557]
MKKTILLFVLATSLFAFSASKTSKKSRRIKKERTTSTSKKSGKKKDAMNMERFSFHDLANYPNRPAPTNYKKVREEYFRKNPDKIPPSMRDQYAK